MQGTQSLAIRFRTLQEERLPSNRKNHEKTEIQEETLWSRQGIGAIVLTTGDIREFRQTLPLTDNQVILA